MMLERLYRALFLGTPKPCNPYRIRSECEDCGRQVFPLYCAGIKCVVCHAASKG